MTLTRRDFLQETVVGLSVAALFGEHSSASAQRPPNVVFILADDLGWSDLGCYGNAFHETPNIDRLAAQGMRFTDAYAACPVCSPTRASIMSGQYPARVGITDFIPGHQRPWAKLQVPLNRQQYLPLEIVTIPEVLKDADYVSGAFGKWHLGGREYFPDHQGFDEILVSDGRHFNFSTFPATQVKETDYLAEVLTGHGERFLETHAAEPFFLYLSHFAVHIPLEARQEFIAYYEQKAKPPTGVNNPVYAAMVAHVDQSVGRLLEKIRALGLDDNTIVIFTSDNGGLRQRYDGQGPIVTTNAPLRGEKGTLYEGGIREPLIIRWPGVTAAGSVCTAPVSSVDFYPTILEWAGVSPNDAQPCDGVPLTGLLKAQGAPQRPGLFWHYPHYHHSTPAGAVRCGDWKLIEFFEENRLELYNLAEDIGETRDHAADMPDLADELHTILRKWRMSVNAAMPAPNPGYDPARAGEWGTRKKT